MKFVFLNILLSFIAFISSSKAQNAIDLDIRISKEVNVLHFVDHLSQWSPYTGDDAVVLYTSEFSMSKEDSLMLELYKINREQLGWESEINLFNWADHDYDFSLIDDSVKYEYQAIKLVVDYFLQRKTSKKSLKEILNNKFKKLESLKPDIISYTAELESMFTEIDPYLKVWKEDLNFSHYPIYICYSHKENSSHGGANGDGVYSEFDVIAGRDFIEIGFGIITHEITHKVTRVGETILDMVQADSTYPEKAIRFIKKYNLTTDKLVEILKSRDPNGFGNPEYKVFEEVYVYFISPVLIHQYSDDKIADKKKHYEAKSQLELARIWHGVSLFKEELQNLDSQNLDKDILIWQLIEIYYEEIYFPNYQ